jgi:hypothetical protein
MAEQTSPVTLPPEIADKLNKGSVQLGQLGELLHVLRLDKQSELVRRLVKKHQDGTIGQSEAEGSEMPASSSEDSERVQLGDNNYTIYTEQERPAVAQAASQAAPAIASVGKSILPYVLAAALGGTGLGAGAMAIPVLMKGAEKVTQAVDTDTDTNTQYTLEFGEPKTEH